MDFLLQVFSKVSHKNHELNRNKKSTFSDHTWYDHQTHHHRKMKKKATEFNETKGKKLLWSHHDNLSETFLRGYERERVRQLQAEML